MRRTGGTMRGDIEGRYPGPAEGREHRHRDDEAGPVVIGGLR